MRPHAIHHIHKRLYSRKNSKWIRLLDRFLVVIAVLCPLTSLPQLVKIIFEKSAAGVSIATWTLLAFLAIPWLVYGLVHRDKPIILSYLLWFILDTAVVVAALMYS